MKTKKCRSILIESRDQSILHLNYGNVLNLGKVPEEVSEEWKSYPKQLILISLEDEKIEVNDICYYENNLGGGKFLVKYIGNNIYHKLGINSIEEYGSIEGGIIPLKSEVFKVIAIQDQLSTEYISRFVEQYNRGCVKDVEIEMRDDQSDCHGCVADCYEKGCKVRKPKLTNGFMTILENEHNEISINDWEADIAIKNIPELSHVISSVRELRRYYIDGIQVGYNKRKQEEPVLYTEEEVKEFVFRAYNLRTEDHVVRSTNSLNDWFDQNKKK